MLAGSGSSGASQVMRGTTPAFDGHGRFAMAGRVARTVSPVQRSVNAGAKKAIPISAIKGDRLMYDIMAIMRQYKFPWEAIGAGVKSPWALLLSPGRCGDSDDTGDTFRAT